jgi:hypothetical protein
MELSSTRLVKGSSHQAGQLLLRKIMPILDQVAQLKGVKPRQTHYTGKAANRRNFQHVLRSATRVVSASQQRYPRAERMPNQKFRATGVS